MKANKSPAGVRAKTSPASKCENPPVALIRIPFGIRSQIAPVFQMRHHLPRQGPQDARLHSGQGPRNIGGNANKIVETLLRRSIQYPIIPENSRPPGFVPGQRRLHKASSNAHSITIRPFSNSYSLASGLPLLTTEVPSYSVTDCVTFCDCDANCLKFGQNPAGSASLLQRFSVRLLGSLATPFGRFLRAIRKQPDRGAVDYPANWSRPAPTALLTIPNVRFQAETRASHRLPLIPHQQSISFVWVCRHVGLCSPFAKVSFRKRSPWESSGNAYTTLHAYTPINLPNHFEG